MERPVLVERVEQDGTFYTLEWWCTPPADRGHWQAVRDEWDADQPIRRVYEWKMPDA